MARQSALSSQPRPQVATALLSCVQALGLVETLVGVLWCQLLSRTSSSRPDLTHTTILAGSIWLSYVGDRLLDTRKPPIPATARHRFHAQFWKPLSLLWVAGLAATVRLSLASLTGTEWLRCAAIGVVTLVYLASAGRLGRHRPLLKKVTAAGIYVLGTTVFVDWTYSLNFAVTLSGYAALVLANLLYIGAAELPAQPRGRFRLFGNLSLLCSLSAAVVLWLLAQGTSALPIALLISGGALLCAWSMRMTLSAERLHQLADGALLLPLPLLMV